MKEYKYTINGNKYTVGIGDIEDGIAQVEVNGVPYKVEMEKKAVSVAAVSAPKPAAAPRQNLAAAKAAAPAAAGGFKVVSPLPGVVVSINVKVGDEVKASDTVAVLEAMKMENAIHAGRDGKVVVINANAGESVLEGTALVTLG